MSNEIEVIPDQWVMTMRRKPEHVLAEAQNIGTKLKKAIEENRWAIHLGGTNPHLRIEGAQYLGHIFQASARVVSGATHHCRIDDVHGYETEAELVSLENGSVITRASGMCMSDEENWSGRPKYEGHGNNRRKVMNTNGQPVIVPTPLYALRSMAETRACSKAYRLWFGWIYTIHGFEATGAEEMPGYRPPGSRGIQQPQERQTAGNVITQEQRVRLRDLAVEHGKSGDEVIAIMQHYGFGSSQEITRDKYDEILAEIRKPDAAQ